MPLLGRPPVRSAFVRQWAAVVVDKPVLLEVPAVGAAEAISSVQIRGSAAFSASDRS
jgi:hypothetical protein